MRYRVGDLVRCRFDVPDVGVVVKVEKANCETLRSSKHSDFLVKSSPDIYYVFFPNHSYEHPYYAAELFLESEAPVGTVSV